MGMPQIFGPGKQPLKCFSFSKSKDRAPSFGDTRIGCHQAGHRGVDPWIRDLTWKVLVLFFVSFAASEAT